MDLIPPRQNHPAIAGCGAGGADVAAGIAGERIDVATSGPQSHFSGFDRARVAHLAAHAATDHNPASVPFSLQHHLIARYGCGIALRPHRAAIGH